MLTLNDGRAELWQWDTGRTLAVDADCSQVHFSNKVFGRSIDVDVAGGVAIIPDILLQTDKDLNVWAFVGTAESGYTKISKTFKVNRRNKPADYVFTPVEQTTIDEIAAIAQSVRDDADAGVFNGETGATPNIQIGTVETLPAGSPATASMTGTAENPLLNMWIPEGGEGKGGTDGGYYTPAVTQPDTNTMRLSFTPSKADMPAVSDTEITIPSGGSGSVVVDSTLTVSGQAADAKATGDAIRLLSEEIGNVADEVDAIEALAECGILTPAYQNGVFYTDASGAIYTL